MTSQFDAYTTDEIREYLLLSRKQILSYLGMTDLHIDRSKPDWVVSYTQPDGTIQRFTVKQGKDMVVRTGNMLAEAAKGL